MSICSDFESDDEDVLQFKRLALRDAVICVGWLKLLSVIYYVFLYFLVHIYSKGDVSTTLKVMLLLAIPCQVLNGILLFYGALEERMEPLEVALWMCLSMASYNTIMGTVGCIYFIRTGQVHIHFMLAFAFVMLAFSLFTVLCHDVLIVYAYKQIIRRIKEQQSLDRQSEEC